VKFVILSPDFLPPLDLDPLSSVAAVFFGLRMLLTCGSQLSALLVFIFLGITSLFLCLESERCICGIHFATASAAPSVCSAQVATRGDSSGARAIRGVWLGFIISASISRFVPCF
jgi:hypothetical protein